MTLRIYGLMRKKPLIICETVFCDFEQDPTVWERYYPRLVSLLASSRAMVNKRGWRFIHVVYCSTDKAEIIARLRKLAGKTRDRALILVPYTHPPGGYGYTVSDHPDEFKQPNRLAALRDAAFRLARPHIVATGWLKHSDIVIRTAIDDDDLFAHWHADELVGASRFALGPGHEPAAFGFQNGYLAIVHDQGPAELRQVVYSLAVSGQRAIVYRATHDIEAASPWSVPERIDETTVRSFKDLGISVSMLAGNRPSTAYTRRRSGNLSGHGKDWCIESVVDTAMVDGEAALLHLLATRSPPVREGFRPYVLPPRLTMTCGVKDGQLWVRSNYGLISRPEDRIAFTLHRDGQKVADSWYAREPNRTFDLTITPGEYQVRAYLRRGHEVVVRAGSRKITVPAA